MGNKKKDKEKREGSSSSLSGNECEAEKTKKDNPPTPLETPKKNPEEEKTHPISPDPVSPEITQRMTSIEQNQVRMEKSLLEQFSLLREERRERSASAKRKREGGNDIRSGSKVGRRANMSASQQPQGNVNANIIPQYFSQAAPQVSERQGSDNTPPMTEQSPPTGPRGEKEKPAMANAWDQGPPKMPHTDAPKMPEFDLKLIQASIESLRGMGDEIIKSAAAEGVSEIFARQVANAFSGYHNLIELFAQAMQTVPNYIQRSSSVLLPKPSVLKKIETLDIPEMNRTINSVRTTDRERELDRCSRSVRVFNVENRNDENAYQTINRTFDDLPRFKNPLLGSKCFFLGNPKANQTVPIVVEFSGEEKKTEFMSAIRKNEENVFNSKGDRYSASIHWPKDLAERVKEWKQVLSANPKNDDLQFYFSYKKNAKMIKIASCKKNATTREWETFSTFPIPQKNAKKVFRGLPEILGGDPPVESTVETPPPISREVLITPPEGETAPNKE